jgi:hypothetical protein
MSAAVKSTSQSAVAGASVALTLYLKHFRDSTIDYVLRETGYSSITEYEDLCYQTDMFPIEVTVNGMIQTYCPTLDLQQYRLFKLSLHHLHERVRRYLLDNYIGMSSLDYEMLHASSNTIVIWIPYKDESVRRSSSFSAIGLAPGVDEEEEVFVKKSGKKSQKVVVAEEKVVVPEVRQSGKKARKVVVEDDDDKPIVPLFGWRFKLNPSTNNSYVLSPPTAVQWVKSGTVGWGEGKTTPTSWEAPIDGLTRPVYFNNATGGWVVSLRLREEMVRAGARELK